MNNQTEYKNAKQLTFDLVPTSQAVRNWLASDSKAILAIEPSARLPRIADFPFAVMRPGESFLMHKGDHWPGRFSDVRDKVRRCNATKAAFFVCVWINERKTLEVARIA